MTAALFIEPLLDRDGTGGADDYSVQFGRSAGDNLEVICPFCGTVDAIVEEDRCTRFNPIEFTYVEHVEPRPAPGNEDIVGFVAELDRDFETVGYLCSACDHPVQIPGDVEISWG